MRKYKRQRSRQRPHEADIRSFRHIDFSAARNDSPNATIPSPTIAKVGATILRAIQLKMPGKNQNRRPCMIRDRETRNSACLCHASAFFFFLGGDGPGLFSPCLFSRPGVTGSTGSPSLAHSWNLDASILSSRVANGRIAACTAAAITAARSEFFCTGPRALGAAVPRSCFGAGPAALLSAAVRQLAGQLTSGFTAVGDHLSTFVVVVGRLTASLMTASPSSCCRTVVNGGSPARTSHVRRQPCIHDRTGWTSQRPQNSTIASFPVFKGSPLTS